MSKSKQPKNLISTNNRIQIIPEQVTFIQNNLTARQHFQHQHHQSQHHQNSCTNSFKSRLRIVRKILFIALLLLLCLTASLGSIRIIQQLLLESTNSVKRVATKDEPTANAATGNKYDFQKNVHKSFQIKKNEQNLQHKQEFVKAMAKDAWQAYIR